MFKFAAFATLAALAAAPAFAQGYGLGTVASEEQVLAWDIDVSPFEPTNLIGSGSAEEGEEVYMERCASCHGDFADGGDEARYPVLVGGSVEGLTRPNPNKTIGSYWPYASTVVDYIYRAMPFGEGQQLTKDEAYAVSAWLLAENGIIDRDFVLSNENIRDVVMPNAANFYMDDRDEEGTMKRDGEPCMRDCVADVEITHYARVIDVTPDADVEGLSAE